MINPARKAPSASDIPNADVTYAAPRPMNTTDSVKISRFLSSAMRRSARGTARRPPRTRTATTTLSRIFRSDAPTLAVLPASSGASSMSGTTQRSWNSRIATAILPCGVSSSARSL